MVTEGRFQAWVIGVLCWVGIAGQLQAQEHPYIGSYELREIAPGVMVNWSIRGGNTCEGMDVERSLDGVNFTSVYHLEGICGDVDQPMPYRFFDADPPEFRQVYYRIKLGFDGYSSVKDLFVQQLKESDHRFFPNPVLDRATLVVRTASAQGTDLRVFDASGALVYKLDRLPGQEFKLDLADLPAGAYSYQATSGSARIAGRFVKQ